MVACERISSTPASAEWRDGRLAAAVAGGDGARNKAVYESFALAVTAAARCRRDPWNRCRRSQSLIAAMRSAHQQSTCDAAGCAQRQNTLRRIGVGHRAVPRRHPMPGGRRWPEAAFAQPGAASRQVERAVRRPETACR
jgi:hypothetical protein